MSNEVAVTIMPPEREQLAAFEWTPDKTQLLKDTICKGATDEELRLFAEVCKSKKLDPFSKQIYAMKRWDSTLRRESITFQTGIDGFRTVAQRTGQYAGQDEPLWCGSDGQWRDVWLDSEPPRAAKVTVFRHGFIKPISRVALYTEYLQTDKEGRPNSMWRKMPANQLAKCAEALALRAAFPEELSGLYTNDEMGQADNYSRQEQAEVATRRVEESRKQLAEPDEDQTPEPERIRKAMAHAKDAQVSVAMKALNQQLIQHCEGSELAASVESLRIVKAIKPDAKKSTELDLDGRKLYVIGLVDYMQTPYLPIATETKQEPSDDLKGLYAQMTDFGKAINVLQMLKKRLALCVGDEIAEGDYKRILGEASGDPKKNKGNLLNSDQQKAAVAKLYEMVVKEEATQEREANA